MGQPGSTAKGRDAALILPVRLGHPRPSPKGDDVMTGSPAAEVEHVEHGHGMPLVALHGAGVDHREIEAAVEAALPNSDTRRIYPDLPGMGRSTAGSLAANEDVVTVLCAFLDGLDAGPVVLIGHSYGGYLARGVADRRPDLVRGLGLICPVADGSRNVPPHRVVRQDADAYDELPLEQRSGFDEYFVVRTSATARRYRDHVVPGTKLVNEAALGRIFAAWRLDVGTRFTAPTLIAAGRRDAVAGYADAIDLLDNYPRSTLAIVENAGHALMHEQPAVLAALLAELLDRTGH
jgi:pimeloyl-ACP methyl ester carboxylesterase